MSKISQTDEALKGIDTRLNGLLDKAVKSTEILKDSFAKMKDSVPTEVWDHVNASLDKTKQTATEISEIESLRGTSAYESAKTMFSIDTKIQQIAKDRLKLTQMRADMSEDAYNVAVQTLNNEEQVLATTKEKWKFDGLVNDKQKEMEKNLIGMQGGMMKLVALGKAFLLTILMNPIAVILTVMVGLLAMAWAQYQRLDKLAQSLYETTGLTTKQVEATVNQAQKLQLQFKKMGLELEDVSKSALAIQSVMGSLNNATDSLVVNVGKMQNQFGISAAEAAKVSDVLMTINGGSEKAAFATAQIVKNLSEAAGTDAGQVMKDIASAGGEALKYFGGNSLELGKAAVEARRLGLELSVLTGSADKLLDLQSSIAAEYKAEALLGRHLNVDKVRGLMYQGKMVEAGKEILKQAGSLADFQKLGPIKGKALAEAYGMTYEQMAKMLANEQRMAGWHEDERAHYEKQMSAQKFNVDQSYAQWEIEQKRASDLKDMSQKFEEIKIQIGNYLVPYIERFMTWITSEGGKETLESIGNVLKDMGKWLLSGITWLTQHKELAIGIAAVWGGAKILGGIKSFTSGLGGGLKSAQGLGGSMDKLSKSLKGMPKGGGGGNGVMGQVVGKLKPSQIIAGGVAMVLLAGAVWVMAKAMQEFSTGVSWPGVIMGIVSLLALAGVAILLGTFAPVSIVGAAAMVVLAGAMWVLGKAMQEFSKAAVILIPVMNALFEGIALIINSIADAFVSMMNATATSFERIAKLGGGKLLSAAGGMTAVAVALALFGGGSLLGGIASGIGEFFGGDPVTKFERFAKIAPGLETAGASMDMLAKTMPILGNNIQDLANDVSGFSMKNMTSQMDGSIPHFLATAAAIDKVGESMASVRSEQTKSMVMGVANWISNVITGGGGESKQQDVNLDLGPLLSEIKYLRSDLRMLTIDVDGQKLGKVVTKYQDKLGKS